MGGATVGQKVMKLSVRDATTGGPITQQQAINRWLFVGAPFAISFLYAWGIIGWIVWLRSRWLRDLPARHDGPEPDPPGLPRRQRQDGRRQRLRPAAIGEIHTRPRPDWAGSFFRLCATGRRPVADDLSTGYPQ